MRKSFFPLLALLLVFTLLTQTISVMATQTEESYSDYEYSYPEAYYWPAQTDSIAGWPAAPSIEAEAAVLMDAKTGNLLYAKNKDDIHYPASITKIMTTLLALEHCDDFKETVTFSSQAVYTTEEDSSSIYAVEGEQLRMSQCLYAIMLASANEAAYAVAEHSCGNLKRFVEEMNQRAKEIGCEHTHFNNASGLPDEHHYTTAYDMALIAREAWQNRWFRKIAGTANYTIPKTNKTEEPRDLYNHHKMLTDYNYLYKGCVGGKTGYTNVAGNTLVTYVRRGSVTLIAVVLKGSSAVYSDTKAILDYGFSNFHRLSIKTKGASTITPTLLPNLKYILPQGGTVEMSHSYADAYVVVPKGVEEKDLITRTTYLPNAVGNWMIQTDYYYSNWKVGVSYSYLQRPLVNLFPTDS